MHPLEQLRDDALAQIASAPDQRVLETVRVKFLGRGGSVSEWSDKMKSLPKEEKPAVGKLLNEVRVAITAAIEARAENFRAEKESAAVANIDLSLPGTPHERGALHPLTQMLDRSIAIFRRMGFALAEGPTSRPNGIVSMPSTLPLTIPRATSRTHFIYRTVACCAPTHPRCKSARWNQRCHPFASSLPARLTDAMRSTPLIPASFIRSKVFTSMKMSASPI